MTARRSDDAADDIDIDDGVPVTLEEVQAEGRRRSVTLSSRFNPMDVDRIRVVAQREGLGVTQLVRSWVLEALDAAEETADRDEPSADLMRALEANIAAAKAAQKAARSELRRRAAS